jgi:hypothetical protein
MISKPDSPLILHAVSSSSESDSEREQNKIEKTSKIVEKV